MSNSIIVYRNPLEQMFWENFATSPVLIPVFGGMVTSFIAMIILIKLLTFIRNKNRKLFYYISNDVINYTSCFLAAIIGMVVFKILNI